MYLPYGQSDFIFAIIVEELGFLGALAVIGLFAFLVYRGIKVAAKAPDLFGASLACGIITIIAVQGVRKHCGGHQFHSAHGRIAALYIVRQLVAGHLYVHDWHPAQHIKAEPGVGVTQSGGATYN